MEQLLFAVGPVKMHPETCRVGGEALPYFRTAEFSRLMLDAEADYLRLLGAPEGSRAVFLSCSGTGGMDAILSCVLGKEDKALVIDGGGFGHRFVELCRFYGVEHEALELRPGQMLTEERLFAVNTEGMTALLVNLHETSTGTLYDIGMLGRFCKERGLLFVIDAVSAFLCEDINMAAAGADVVLTASQKALACAPGMALLALSPRAQEKIEGTEQRSYYLNLQSALDNGKRGQPPFTLSESVMLQVSRRLRGLQNGGMEQERALMQENADFFRREMSRYPFTLFSENPALGCTALRTPENLSAHELFLTLKDEYGICVCPNGGALRDTVFRVGHMGDLCREDYLRLLSAFDNLQRRGKL